MAREQWVAKPEAIRKLRNEKLWTQATLAEMAGLALYTIERAENDEGRHLTLETMRKLCKALNCKPNRIATLATHMNERVEMRSEGRR